MDPEKILAVAALVWYVGSLVAMGRSVRRGRELADMLATRHPDTYEELGRPRPGYFESVRRTKFANFVARREYEQLADDTLAAHFDAHRKAEATLVIGIIGIGVIIAMLVVALRGLV